MAGLIRAGTETTSTHRVITIGARQSVTLSLKEVVSSSGIDLFPEVESKGYFKFHFSGKELQLTAGSYIGLIPINPRITIDVRPKLPVGNLARVVALSQMRLTPLEGIEKLYSPDDKPSAGILEFLALGLLSSLKPIEVHGYHKIYLAKEENTSHPRGRIDLRRTVLFNGSRGIRHKVITRRFEQTTDSPYNQVIKHALMFLAERFARAPSLDRKLSRELNRALGAFQSIKTDRSAALVRKVDSDLRQKRIPQGRMYYEKALRIALTIIAGRGISLVNHGQEVELSSYVVNFDDLFEAYLREVLRLKLQGKGYRVLDGNSDGARRLFDDKKQPFANPDIVILNEKTKGKVVIDAKYKHKTDRSDLNQAVTYSACYRSKEAVLVHQSIPGDKSGREYTGSIESMRFHTYKFDLSALDLEREEQAFSDSMAALTL